MPTKDRKKEESSSWKKVALPILFGLAFGFLLQKAGVAKYHVLVGVLLFQDATVIKVMLSAILVGMMGLFLLQRLGKTEPKIKPTRYGANIIGGLVFGAGFALSGYCPGTGAAALGQMNWDALFMIAGMIVGSYLFAEVSEWLSKTVQRWGDRGKITLPEILAVPGPAFLAGFIIILALGLVLLERLD